MKAINVCVLNGYLGRDASLKETNLGTPVLEFVMCVNTTKKTDEGWEDEPNWFDFTLYGSRATAIAGKLTKGANVTCKGYLKQDTWETREGQKRSKTRIIVDDIYINSVKNSGENLLENSQKLEQNSSIYADENIPF